MDIGKDLTKRQQEIFDFIKKYSARYGYPPTVRDIGKAVGLASSSASSCDCSAAICAASAALFPLFTRHLSLPTVLSADQ